MAYQLDALDNWPVTWQASFLSSSDGTSCMDQKGIHAITPCFLHWHMKDLFWELKILQTSTPLALCSVLMPRHWQLKFSQLKRVSKGYIYMEHDSKSCLGGVAQMKIENKVVPLGWHPRGLPRTVSCIMCLGGSLCT